MKMVSKKYISLVLIIFFLFHSFSLVHSEESDEFLFQNQEKESVLKTKNITLHSSDYHLTQDRNGKTKIDMNEFGFISQPGFPKLPSKLFTIQLPSNTTILSLFLLNSTSEKLSGFFDVIISPPLFPLNSSNYLLTKPAEPMLIAKKYPESIFSLEGKASFHQLDFLQIRFNPFTYSTEEKSLIFHKEITLQITYSQPLIMHQNVTKNYNDSAVFSIIPPNDIQSFATTSSPCFSQENIDYLIITTKNLESSVLFLQYWRELTGYNTHIVMVSDIFDQYNGIDEAEKIRNFLIEKYQIWNLKYVLIIGSNALIPMRNCYPNADNHASSGRTPTDYYYADLTGDWDADHDGFYGERGDDNPDFIADVSVGRIPVDQPYLVEKICQKIIEFEQTNDQWKKKALHIGAFLNLENEDNSGYEMTDGAYLMESLSENILSPRGYQITSLYEKEGLSPSIFSSDYHLTRKNVSTELTNGYGLVNWNAHGSSSAAFRLYWKNDDGDGIPESRETASPAFVHGADTVLFNDDKPGIVFSCSCENSYPEYSNLGASFLENGAVSFIGASRNAWGTIGWQSENDGGSSSLDYLFTEYLIGRDETVGSALYKAKYDYFTKYDWWDWKTHQNMYAFNLYGDPATSFETITSFHPPGKPVILVAPDKGVIKSDLVFSASASDNDGHQLFYQWNYDDGLYSSWFGPFESGKPVEMTLQWDESGSHNVAVRVKDVSGMTSEWSESFEIEIQAPRLEIIRIRSGIGSLGVLLENTGDVVAEKINWSIHLQGGFQLNSEENGSVESLLPGRRTMIRYPFLFGIGFSKVTIEFDSKKLDKQTESTTALILGPIIII